MDNYLGQNSNIVWPWISQAEKKCMVVNNWLHMKGTVSMFRDQLWQGQIKRCVVSLTEDKSTLEINGIVRNDLLRQVQMLIDSNRLL